jgi:chromosome segregation ATPase
MSEARIDRLELRFDGLDDRLRRIEDAVIRIEATLAATLPHLATKAELATGLADVRSELGSQISSLRTELADKPSRLYMWGVMAAMTAAYTAALAAMGVLLTYLPVLHHAP